MGATMRATTARVLGSTAAEILSTVPWNGPVPLPGSIVRGIVEADRGEIARRDLRQHPHLRQVGDGEGWRVPACSSWPGVICLSTTVPETGRPDDAADAGRRRPAIDVARSFRDRRPSRRAPEAPRRGRLRRSRHRSAPAQPRARRCRCARQDPGRPSASLRALARRRRPPFDTPRSRSHNRPTGPARAAGPCATCWPSATRIRVTGPVKGDTTRSPGHCRSRPCRALRSVCAIADGHDRVELDVAALRLGQRTLATSGRGCRSRPDDDEQPATRAAQAQQRSPSRASLSRIGGARRVRGGATSRRPAPGTMRPCR